MSNLTILERLEIALSSYEKGDMSRSDFVNFLTNSINALEGVPYSIRLELRDHEYNIETDGYFEEKGFESKSVAAKEVLKAWIQELKEEYATGNC